MNDGSRDGEGGIQTAENERNGQCSRMGGDLWTIVIGPVIAAFHLRGADTGLRIFLGGSGEVDDDARRIIFER